MKSVILNADITLERTTVITLNGKANPLKKNGKWV